MQLKSLRGNPRRLPHETWASVCFSCELHSSIMVLASESTNRNSSGLRLLHKVSNMQTCAMRDSSTIIEIE